MEKIETLTDEQRARFGEFVERWTDIGLSTQAADRPRAESAMRKMYEIAGLSPPSRIIWCGSPLSMALTRAVLLKIPEVEASVWASVGDSVEDSVRDSVGDSVRASVRASVGASVRDSVRDSVWASVWASVGDSVEDSVRDSVWASVWASVRDSVWASVGDSVEASVWASVRAGVRASVGDSVYGQHDAGWLAFYAYFKDVLGLTSQTQRLDGLWEFAQSAGWAIPCRDICFIAERHTTLNRDERGRLHCETGPAVAYPDGWKIYAVHGVRLDGWIVEQPERISIQDIESEKNTEIQRVMIERFGWDRYAAECGAAVIDHSEQYGTLYGRDGRAEFLRVINRSPEPDGSFRQYILPVAPGCEPLPDGAGDLGDPQNLTALNAVASTFGMTGKEYASVLEAES